jgi:predicted alpha/beta hydrolase family esterase
MARSFLILHGTGGSCAGHWQSILASQLSSSGTYVIYPELPDKDTPNREAWQHALTEAMRTVPDASALTVVCHSLGNALWAHHAASGPPHAAVDRLVMVAPAGPSVLRDFRPTFWPLPEDAGRSLRASATHRLLVASGNDPRCPEVAARYYAPLGIEAVQMPDAAGHINTESGFGEWPEMLRMLTAQGGGLQSELLKPISQGPAAADASAAKLRAPVE